ncbi:magnesium/cobalt transporter CorA [Staphylococcus equorum]|uniref:Magnesium transport protein CorA n=1 Tax=Staphylococcus equorum TaxID=246432 RepID=A0A9X4L8E2_9STAP|nr:magnesium/cobalt transporter CorA [Staphylococcus equorum]MDG0819171.1 magnesium/cobalt transporter CorA [Staphylococcus equorum]MDG0839812.1 magnesium/cobalt transporter CorA [Staphylococcus equorum]MDG0845724.1 magnesium/cobalt transporter CorA [Staphylococcus equorum]
MSVTIKYQTSKESLSQVNHFKEIPESATFIWCDFNNPSDEENEMLQSYFNFNQLEIDDTINGTPRAKYKIYNTYQYIAFHSVDSQYTGDKVLNLYNKDNMLITYHHKHFEVLQEVEQYISSHYESDLDASDVILYILDKVVDTYFELIYDIENKVYELEDRETHGSSTKEIMDDVFKIRSKIIKLKRIIYPMRELVDNMKESSQLLVDDKNHMYIQHIDDHMIKQENIINLSQEMTEEIRDNYSSYSYYKMNSIMQILTLVSVVFLPLTLITGIYGMNFSNIAELQWHYGYYIVLVIMLAISIGSIFYFKKEKWF